MPYSSLPPFWHWCHPAHLSVCSNHTIDCYHYFNLLPVRSMKYKKVQILFYLLFFFNTLLICRSEFLACIISSFSFVVGVWKQGLAHTKHILNHWATLLSTISFSWRAFKICFACNSVGNEFLQFFLPNKVFISLLLDLKF